MSIRKLDLKGSITMDDGDIQLHMQGTTSDMLEFGLRVQTMILMQVAERQKDGKPAAVHRVMLSKYLAEQMQNVHEACVQELVGTLLDDGKDPNEQLTLRDALLREYSFDATKVAKGFNEPKPPKD